MAQIRLVVNTDLKQAKAAVDTLKTSFADLAKQLSTITVNKNLTAQLNALTKYYDSVANAGARAAQQTRGTAANVETLRRGYANLINQLNTLQKQYASGTFDAARKSIEQNFEAVKKLSQAQEVNGDEVKRLSGEYKKLAADVAQFRAEGEKLKTSDPFSPKQGDSIFRLQKQYASLLNSIKSAEQYYPKGTFDGIVKGAQAAVTGLQALGQEYTTTGTLSDASQKQLNTFSEGLNRQRAAFETTKSSAQNYHGTLRDLISGFLKFQISASIVMNSIQLIRSAFNSLNETLVETEKAVVSLQRVLDETVEGGQIADSLYEIAERLGQTFENVQEIAQNFAKAGLSWQDTLAATEAAVLALNVAELTATESSEGLIAVMQQFNYEASELTYVIDVLNKAADKSAVDTADLLVALQKTGSYAAAANLSLEDTVGLISALSEATAASGQNIGNALKSLFAYSSKDSALDTFAQLSDDMKEVIDLYQIGRASILDVWEQLSKEMQSLSAEQADLLEQWSESSGFETELGAELSDIYESLAGVYDTAGIYRKNYFIALMNNFDEVQEVMGEISDASGYTAEEQSKYMDTYEAKLNALQAQWQHLANDEQGWLAFKKGLLDIASGLLTAIEYTGGLRTVVLALGTALWVAFGDKIISAIKSFGTAIKSLVTGLKNVATAGMTAQTALGWIGVAATAISAVVGAVQAYQNAQEEARQATIDAWNAEKDRASELASLYEQYEALDTLQSRSIEQENEYLTLQESIAAILSEKTNRLEELTVGTDEYREAIEKLTNAELKEYAQQAEAAAQAAKAPSALDGHESQIGLSGKNWDKELWNELEAAGFDLYESSAAGYVSDRHRIEINGKNIYEQLDEARKLLDWLYKNDYSDNGIYSEIYNLIEENESAAQEYIETIASAEAWKYRYNNGTPQGQADVDSIVNSIMSATGATETWREEIEGIVVGITGVKEVVSETKEDLDDQVKTLGTMNEESLDALSEYLQGLRDAEDEAAKLQSKVDAIAEAEKELAETREEAAKALAEAEQELEDARKDVNDAMVDLLDKQSEAVDKLAEAQNSLASAAENINSERLALQDELADAEEKLADLRVNAEEKILDLQEKQLAVEEAKKALEDARNNRSLWVYNDATGAYEWSTDQSAIKEAEDELASAEEAKEEAKKQHEEVLSQIKEAEDELSLVQTTIADAEKAIDEAISKGYDISKEIWEEEKGIATGVRDAIQAYIDAQNEVDAAQEDVNQYTQAVKEAQDAITAAFNEGLLETQEITKTTQSLASGVLEAIELVKEAQKGISDQQVENAESIAKAEEALQEAVDELNTYIEDQAWDDVIDEIKSGNTTNEKVQELLDKWKATAEEQGATDVSWYEKIVDSIKEYSGVDITIQTEDQSTDSEEEQDSDSNSGTTGSGGSDSSITIWSGGKQYMASKKAYDSGGIADGLGYLSKATSAPETVNDPELTKKILTPTSNAQFDRYVRDMGIMFEIARSYAQSPIVQSTVGNTTNNNTDNSIIINGVKIGSDMMSRPFGEVLQMVSMVPTK